MMASDHKASLPQGTFRLFANPTRCRHSPAALKELVNKIIYSNRAGPGQIPAGFTYFGQFIAHDISHISDPPTGHQLSTPELDLDSLYGTGFDDPRAFVNTTTGELKVVIVHDECGRAVGFDLPRFAGIANIPDERNDDNLLVSQMHALWCQIHNLLRPASGKPRERFEIARERTLALYHSVIRDDYLKQICNRAVYQTIFGETNGASTPDQQHLEPVFICKETLKEKGLPIELVAAAFRFGHSMVLPAYNINQRARVINKSLEDLFTMTGRGGLMGHSQLPSDWTVDWNMFFEIDGPRDRKVNKAQEISPKIERALHDFDNDTVPLPYRTLNRANQWQLACAQTVMDEFVNKMEHRFPNLVKSSRLNCATSYTASSYLNSDLCKLEHNIIWDQLAGRVPLWYFILSEDWLERPEPTERRGHLGTVGSWLVAETMLGLIGISPEPCFHSSKEAALYAAKSKLGLSIDESSGMHNIIKSTLNWSNI